MARTGKAHTSEDIWHLSIDDLLDAPKEPARLAGRGPFVINLSTSTASIGPPPTGLHRFDGLHVYQLRRGPEGRPQFLLRLGIIATEVEADAILSGVLEHYPGATKDSAEDDDRAAIAVKARPAEPPKPVQPPAEKAPEARRPPPNAAPPRPEVAAKPEEPVHWDVDELLPDLPVTRPSRRERPAPPETHAPRKLAALREPSSPRETPMLHEPPTPPEAPPLRETPALRESSALSEPPMQKTPESLATEAMPSAEIEFSAPAPAEAVPTRAVVEELDYDPNAITQAVELPTFTFEALDIEAPTAAAPKVEAPTHEISPVESHSLDLITVEASTIDVATAESPTIEAHELDVIAMEAPANEMTATDELTIEAHELDVIAMEAPANEVTATDELTIEAHELDVITLDTSTTEATLTEAPTIEAYAIDELLAAEAQPTLKPAANDLLDLPVEQAMHVAAEPAAPSPAAAELPGLDAQTPAASEPFTASDLAAPGLALAETSHATNAVDAPVSIAAASEPTADADSGTMEHLVAKIGALVESADAHDTNAIPPQNTESNAHAPTPPPARPAWPIAANASARPAQRPSPPPRVPAVEPAPADALSIDSTQTIRALTTLELADDQSSQWFSIQLSLSEEHIDPEQVPSLDIFSEYRLYSITGLDQDRVMHALRMGFFSSALAAEAVAGYLRGFFDSPCIKRVSLAERERFAEKGVTARKDIGATGVHAVIELATPTLIPERHAQVGESSKPRAPTSMWSRLVAPLKR